MERITTANYNIGMYKENFNKYVNYVFKYLTSESKHEDVQGRKIEHTIFFILILIQFIKTISH